MAEALVSILVEEVAFIAIQQLDKEVRLVNDVDKHVIQLKNNLEAIQVVLEDAERRQLADLNVRNWLDRLKSTSFDMDNLLDKWSTAILKLNMEEINVPTQTRSKLKKITLRLDIARKIKDVNRKLERIVVEKDRFKLDTTVVQEPVLRPKTTSFINEAEIYGRDMDKHILVSKLVSESSTHQDRRLDIIPIIGIGGIGKTTLAQLVYNDEMIKPHFVTHVWVCVSEPFDEIKVAKAIIESIEGKTPNINELETLLQHIRKCIERKRFLLILDDVWTEDKQKWKQLKQSLSSGAIGSRILVTSRKKEVAIIMEAVNYMITLEKLSERSLLVNIQATSIHREKRGRVQSTGRNWSKNCQQSQWLTPCCKNIRKSCVL
ncbi:disease resistance protein RGA2-like [Humulus lupulus]|uniref:disease resistance protein RGA2-like n=1 Tax=Humulus lupulus TaxID=3486 RepID=UPI002B413BCB|nr:disease resistance protein RGA2-like [Humulus lupulus]